MSLEGNDPVIGHGGRVSLGRNQGGQPVTNGQKDLWGKGRASGDGEVDGAQEAWAESGAAELAGAARNEGTRRKPGSSLKQRDRRAASGLSLHNVD
jgi:hypothetical protein